jgi:hypothetical protein
MSAKDFRDYGDECLGWAKTAESEEDRRRHLQMAQTWLKAADHYERARPSRKRSKALDRPPSPHHSPP